MIHNTHNTETDRAAALAQALQRAFGMEEEDALAVTDVVVERFNGEDEVPDEALDAEVRAVFYTLESKKLLAFRREDRPRETQGQKRAFFWRLRQDVVESLLAHEDEAEERDLYETIPSDVWARHASLRLGAA